MKPFLSIIIPTYNRAHLLAKAIDSVLTQMFSDWELIIVDDGSIDNTQNLVHSYKDLRIKYIFQQNAERSAARNNGIKNATGTYICFLDSDDYYLPQRLEFLFTELEKQKFPVAAFYTGLLFKKNGALIPCENEIKSENIFNHFAVSIIHSQQTCIHQNILRDIQYDTRFHIGEDMELWLRIADKFPFIYLPQQNSVVVVEHDDRTVNVKRNNTFIHQMRVFEKIFSQGHPGHSISKKIKRQLISNCYFGIAKHFIYSGDRYNAIKNLLLSMVNDIANRQNKYRLNLIIHLLFLKNKTKQMLEE